MVTKRDSSERTWARLRLRLRLRLRARVGVRVGVRVGERVRDRLRLRRRDSVGVRHLDVLAGDEDDARLLRRAHRLELGVPQPQLLLQLLVARRVQRDRRRLHDGLG